MPRQPVRFPDGRMEWREYEEPKLAPDQVRIRSRFGAAKHGTELAGTDRGRWDESLQLWRPADPQSTPPAPAARGVGNMTVGDVEEAGPQVTDLAVGDRVLTYGEFRPRHVREPARCWKIPAALSWKSAVCLDPADFAFGAIRDGNVRIGDKVAVFGIGAIGLMAVQLLRVAGASVVIAVEPLENRRRLAERLGADIVLDPTACDAGLEIKQATGNGVDVAIEYSGKVQALQHATRGVAWGGTVVAGAYPAPYPAGLDFGAEPHHNLINLVFTRSCSLPGRDHPRWDENRIFQTCLTLLIDGAISGEEIVTPVVDFEELPGEYPKIATQPNEYVKLGARY